MKKMLSVLTMCVFALSGGIPVFGDVLSKWDAALEPLGFQRVSSSSVPSEILASASLWPNTLGEVLSLIESNPSTASQQVSDTKFYSANRTYECAKLVGGLGHGWFRHYVDGVIDRRHGKQIFASSSNNRWAHTGLTLGTQLSNVSTGSSISSDARTLTMRSSWVVSVYVPRPWGDYYFHSESVSNRCSKSP